VPRPVTEDGIERRLHGENRRDGAGVNGLPEEDSLEILIRAHCTCT
jgi:hypothetical protein